MALHLPPARRHQGRPVAVAQLQADRPVRDQHRPGVRLDRGRPHAVPLHDEGDRCSPASPGSTGWREMGRKFPGDQRDLVLLTPTWRNWLVENLAAGSQERHLGSSVLDSEFVREWVGLLNDPALARGVRRRRAHAGLPAPPQPAEAARAARPARPRDDPVLRGQRRAGVLRPRPGARHRLLLDRVQRGLPRAPGRLLPVRRARPCSPVRTSGSVATSTTSATASARSRRRSPRRSRRSPRRSPTAAPRCRSTMRRIEETFPQRDGGCCERVVQAVLRSTRPRQGDRAGPAARRAGGAQG